MYLVFVRSLHQISMSLSLDVVEVINKRPHVIVILNRFVFGTFSLKYIWM